MLRDIVLRAIVWLKKTNFTILREFKMGAVTVKEYVYNMRRYLTDVWPPVSGTRGVFPIQTAIRDEDGADVTELVLRFSGPRRNHVNPLAFSYRRGMRPEIVFTDRGGIRVSLEEKWDPYTGTATITDIFGNSRSITVK